MFYLTPETTFEIIVKRWIRMCSITGLIYCYHLFFAMYGVDQFTDLSGKLSCSGPDAGKISTDPAEVEKAVGTYQTAIGMLAVFHMIEWLRQLVFLTGTLVGVNLMHLYYIMSINVVYGFIACLVGIAARFSPAGEECAKHQTYRAEYLAYNIISLVLLLCFSAFHHVLIFRIMGTEWCHEIYLEEEEDDDD